MSHIFLSPKGHLYHQSIAQSLQSNGWQLSTQTAANICIYLGDTQQGFSPSEISTIDTQLIERFSGAELFLQARANPFARLRCGLTKQGQLVIASPIDDNLHLRIIRLVQNFQRLTQESYEDKLNTLTLDNPTSHTDISENANMDAPTDSSATSRQTSVKDQPDTINYQTESQHSALWQEKLQNWGVEILSKGSDLPPELDHPAIQQVLQNSQALHKGLFPNGDECTLIPFPNLSNPNSKVLCVTSDGGVIALHRRQPTGILSPMVKELLFPTSEITPLWHQKYTGNGDLFAVSSNQVYFKESHPSGLIKSAKVHSWDQRKIRLEGPLFSAVASLFLQWSTR